MRADWVTPIFYKSFWSPIVRVKFSLQQFCAVMTVFLVASSMSYALSDKSKAEIVERIQPVGSVCLQGDATCAGAASNAGSGPKSGEDVYKASCTACHDSGVAGAPKFGDAAVWGERVALGIESVYANAINGKGGMPPKGTCASCSDDELKAAVDYIVENSK